jgi:uncharacterized lipoprotein YddW (UPF0748 family)
MGIPGRICRGVIFGLLLLGLFAHPMASGKEKIMTLSWGDIIWQHEGQGAAALDTPEKVQEAVRSWKNHGVTTVHFRVDDFRILLFHEINLLGANAYLVEWARATRAAWERDLVAVAVKAIKEQGIAVEAYLTIFDEGTPAVILTSAGRPFAWQSRLTIEHPEYLTCDRSLTVAGRKYHWGVLEYAYPEVRAYMLKMITTFSDHYAFDGVFLSTRSHSAPPEQADQYGFNEPIVREYQKRYGRNILTQDFDYEKWRDLRGEYLTQFLREVHDHLQQKGQKLSIGVPQGEYLGPPFGNLKLPWRQWVTEHIVDELVVGHIAQERARYPNLMQRASGYVQNQEENLGLPPIEQAVIESYGPLCRQHGVKLYVDPERFYYVYTHPSYGKGSQPPEVLARLRHTLENIPDVAGLTYDYSDLLGLKRSNE